MATPKTDDKGNKIKFIRKNGRVIPIKAKGGSGSNSKSKASSVLNKYNKNKKKAGRLGIAGLAGIALGVAFKSKALGLLGAGLIGGSAVVKKSGSGERDRLYKSGLKKMSKSLKKDKYEGSSV